MKNLNEKEMQFGMKRELLQITEGDSQQENNLNQQNFQRDDFQKIIET